MKVLLMVDEKSIGTNHFVQEVTGKVVMSIVEALHGVDQNWKNITIKVEREELELTD